MNTQRERLQAFAAPWNAALVDERACAAEDLQAQARPFVGAQQGFRL